MLIFTFAVLLALSGPSLNIKLGGFHFFWIGRKDE